MLTPFLFYWIIFFYFLLYLTSLLNLSEKLLLLDTYARYAHLCALYASMAIILKLLYKQNSMYNLLRILFICVPFVNCWTYFSEQIWMSTIWWRKRRQDGSDRMRFMQCFVTISTSLFTSNQWTCQKVMPLMFTGLQRLFIDSWLKMHIEISNVTLIELMWIHFWLSKCVIKDIMTWIELILNYCTEIGGTVVLFDRKMLRNFRKDGYNWKKKKDGKTVKEAHEHLKVSTSNVWSLCVVSTNLHLHDDSQMRECSFICLSASFPQMFPYL